MCRQGGGGDRQFEACGLNTGRLGKAVWDWQRGGGSDFGMVIRTGSDLGMAATWEWQFGNVSVGMAAGRGPSGRGPSGLGPFGRGPFGLGPSGRGPSGLGPSGRDPSGLGPSGRGPPGVASSGCGPLV